MKGNQEPMLYTTNAAVASLNHVPGFDPLKFLRRTTSRKTGEDVMRLDLRYKKLWFRLACPTGRLKLNALRITEKMAIFEAKVYRDREDAEPLSSYVANCTLDATPGGLYVEAAQEEALDTALSNAGFGIQFADVGSESEEYGSEVPVGAKAEIAKPVQTKVEVAEPVQKQPESVKATPQESAKTDPLDAIMADDMPVPEQVTAEVVEKPKTVVLESVQSAQTPPEPTQNVIVLEQVREFLLRILVVSSMLSFQVLLRQLLQRHFLCSTLKYLQNFQVLIQVSLILETHTLMLLSGKQRLRILQKDLTRTLLSIQATKLVRL